jgi:hypothetical protein
LVLCIAIPGVILGIMYWPTGPAKSGPTITIFGPTLSQNKTIYYSEITDPASFTQIINETLTYINSAGSATTRKYSGITLWDLITYSGVSLAGVSAIQFWASDGFFSVSIPIELCQQANHSLMLIAYSSSQTYSAGENYRFIANHSLFDVKASSLFYTKKLVKIELLNYPDWTITINGSVSQKVNISYSELFTYAPCTGRTGGFIHSINQTVGWSATSTRIISGISVKQILDYLNIQNTTIFTKIRFMSSNSNSTYGQYSWVSQNETMVLVAYAQDGILFNPSDPGYVRAIVDYNLTKTIGATAGNFAVKYLLYIELT